MTQPDAIVEHQLQGLRAELAREREAAERALRLKADVTDDDKGSESPR